MVLDMIPGEWRQARQNEFESKTRSAGHGSED
jgi:hypothetical protein